ncbi:MAG: oxygen-independent coproporphyrinogen III oxidase [Bdellovibrio sp.]|nr:MAG: oxygen-independent coproporphyrinogen III oxidase [Bdellovibrio sp.]
MSSTSAAARVSEVRSLFEKYDVPIPRYTSYPTVPYWEGLSDSSLWLSHVDQSLASPEALWSMYVHVPFCETLCTFCGCNNVISKNHKLEHPYVDHLLQEWNMYLQKVPRLADRTLKHIHLGGGTPTFLSPQSLHRLFSGLFAKTNSNDPNEFEASIEVDPRRTNREHLQVLREFGFNRISMGVQDFEPEVQRLVNRLQPFEITAALTEESRKLGFESVNFDLIYGLAKQTPGSIRRTVEQTLQLRPDRIALYSFALVPWIKPAQRLFKDEDLPAGPGKRELYEIAREMFLAAGYVEVGMDHFALPQDTLARAMQEGTLHRNFMGYTNQRSDLLLALGISGISQTPWSFHQNEKLLPKYETALAEGRIPTHRGHVLTAEDQQRQRQILNLMTKLRAPLLDAQQAAQAADFLRPMIEDGLVEIAPSLRGSDEIRITPQGLPFLRNACAFFDERLKRQKPQLQIFSKSI